MILGCWSRGPQPISSYHISASFGLGRLGTWNERGTNATAKKEEAVDAFRKGKFDLLTLKKKN